MRWVELHKTSRSNIYLRLSVQLYSVNKHELYPNGEEAWAVRIEAADVLGMPLVQRHSVQP